MRKITTLLALLLLCMVGVNAQVVTTWTTAGDIVTLDDFKASAGTGARYAFRMPSTSLPGWCDFVNQSAASANDLTTDYLFAIEEGSTSGTYCLKRVSDNKYLSGNGTFGDTGLDLTLTDRAPSDVSDYDAGYSNSTPYVSFDNASGNHYNCGNASGGLQFRGGTGGWSVYATYGPFYVVTVKCINNVTSETIETLSYIAKDGATVSAPNKVGGNTVDGDYSTTVSGADATINAYYTPAPTETSWIIDVDSDHGTYWRRDGSAAASNKWAATFKSNVENAPVVTITNYDNANAEVGHKFSSESNTAKRKSFSSGTDITWTISVEDGYVITGYSIVGSSNDGDITVTPEKGGNAQTFVKGSSSALKVDGLAEQSTTFNVTSTGDNGLTYSLYQVKVAKAYEVTVNTATGSFTLGNAAGTWNREWVSTETDPQVTVRACNGGTTTMVNNMGVISGSTNIDFRSGSSANSDYIISCSDEYIIVAGSFTGAARNASYPQTVTVEGNNKEFTTTTETFDFPVDSHAKSFNFNLTGSNSGGLAGEIKVVMIKPTTKSVTYNLYYNNELKGTETVNSDLGYAPEVPASLQAPFLSYACDVDEITSTTDVVNVTATWNGPFEISTDFDSAKWYYMTIRGTKYVRADENNITSRTNSSNQTIYGYATNSTNGLSDEYRWAFIGSPFDNFVIINRAWGNGYYLHASSYPQMEQFDPTDGTENAAWGHWTLFVNTASGGSGWGFRCQEGSNYYLNDSGGVGMLQYWNSSGAVSDLGSSLAITDVNSELRTALQSAAPDLSNYNIGTGLGQYTVDVDAYNALQAEATGLIANTNATDDELYAKYLEVKAFVPTLNMPAANTFLYIQSVNGANAYLKSANAGTRETFTTTKDVETIFLWDAEGKLISYSTGIANNNVREAGTVGGDASLFSIVPAVSGNIGQYSLGATYNNNTNYLYSTGVDGSNADRNTYASQFFQNNSFNLEAVTELPVTLKNCKTYLNINEDEYYTTLYLPVTVELPNGVEIYTVTGNNGNSLNVEQVHDYIVPANTAVILKYAPGTTDGEDTYTTNATVCTAASTTTSVLQGTVPAINAVSDSYVLSVSGGKLGFYKFAGTEMKGFRAYYVPTSGNADPTRGFVINFGETTGVGSVVLGSNDKAYDLQGRRVNNAQKGLYIINGKKVVK